MTSKSDEFTLTLGENVAGRLEGSVMFLRIDLAHRGDKSATGKSVRVASTEGNQKVARDSEGRDIHLGINAYVKA